MKQYRHDTAGCAPITMIPAVLSIFPVLPVTEDVVNIAPR
jgi:hypothetical protein